MKKSNERTMGALPNLCFLSHFFHKSPMGVTNCDQLEKYKKSMVHVVHDFFESNGWFKKKIWAHDEHGAHEVKK